MKCHGWTVLAVNFSIAVANTISDANVTACDYDALGPGSYFQGQGDPFGNPCLSTFNFNGPADIPFSYTLHPGSSGESGQPSGGVATAIPGANESAVKAIAFNGGGAAASDDIYYDVINKNTGQPDPGALMLLTLSADATIGTDKFGEWNNSGWDVCVGNIELVPNCDFATGHGFNNANIPGQGAGYEDNEASLPTFQTSADMLQVIPFRTSDGTVHISETVYANLTAEAAIDPSLSVVSPNDILVPLSSFNSDPTQPLFSASDIATLESYDISLSGLESVGIIPSGSAVPEPGTLTLLLLSLVLIGVLKRSRWVA
jgi:PEP-CTERM motif